MEEAAEEEEEVDSEAAVAEVRKCFNHLEPYVLQCLIKICTFLVVH